MSLLLAVFKPVPFGECKHIICEPNEEGLVTVTLQTVIPDRSLLIHNINNIDQAIIETLGQFPYAYVESPEDLIRQCNNVAIESRRGPALYNLNNIYWYQPFGSSAVKKEFWYSDDPLVVVKEGKRYGIVKHPMFYKLGFVASSIQPYDRIIKIRI